MPLIYSKVPWVKSSPAPGTKTYVFTLVSKVPHADMNSNLFLPQSCFLKNSHFNAISSASRMLKAYATFPPHLMWTFWSVLLNISNSLCTLSGRGGIEWGILLELNVKSTSCFLLKLWARYSKRCEPSIKVHWKILHLVVCC